MKPPRRTAALSRHTAPSFVLVGGLELIQLRKLTHLARSLFIELVAMADHVTGRGCTSYAVLCALLDWDRAPTANAVPGATQKRVRGALAELELLRLVQLDPIANEKGKALFFRVASRGGMSASADKRGRLQGTVQKPESQATARRSGRSTPDAGQTAGQGVQETSSSPTPSLSTGPNAVRERLRKARDALAGQAAAAGGRTRAPKGA